VVVGTRPIRLQQPIVHRGCNNDGNKLILGLSLIRRDTKQLQPSPSIVRARSGSSCASHSGRGDSIRASVDSQYS
jgi:hypothetical protein